MRGCIVDAQEGVKNLWHVRRRRAVMPRSLRLRSNHAETAVIVQWDEGYSLTGLALRTTCLLYGDVDGHLIRRTKQTWCLPHMRLHLPHEAEGPIVFGIR